MDCPSEEQFDTNEIREVANIESLRFNIPERRLDVRHTGGYHGIFCSLDSLGLDTRLVSSEQVATPTTMKSSGKRGVFYFKSSL